MEVNTIIKIYKNKIIELVGGLKVILRFSHSSIIESGELHGKLWQINPADIRY